MLRAIVWMLRAKVWMLRKIVWMLRVESPASPTRTVGAVPLLWCAAWACEALGLPAQQPPILIAGQQHCHGSGGPGPAAEKPCRPVRHSDRYHLLLS
eukprot:1194559-Prorocentrum_minimum.AAC.3